MGAEGRGGLEGGVWRWNRRGRVRGWIRGRWHLTLEVPEFERFARLLRCGVVGVGGALDELEQTDVASEGELTHDFYL